jgi:hypothetical protein
VQAKTRKCLSISENSLEMSKWTGNVRYRSRQ